MASMVAGATIGFHIAWFLHNSAVQGASLIQQARHAESTSGSCPGRRGGGSRAGAGGAVRGILEIPSLRLTAPVKEGISDAVLSDAVGHVPASAWPGQPGTSILPAHDVTWFSRIDQLRVGAEIRYVTSCLTYTYLVTAHRVLRASHPVYDTPGSSMVLVTCYPLNALYPVSSRYLVFATLVRVWSPAWAPPCPGGTQALAVPAPHALAAQGLGLHRNHALPGVLQFAGTPTAAWQQSKEPWQAESAALAAYFGAIRSASERQRAWWADLAPAVPASAAGSLWGGQTTGDSSRPNVTLRIQGCRVLGAVLSATITTAGSQPGTYYLAVTETVVNGRTLRITSFRMRPASP